MAVIGLLAVVFTVLALIPSTAHVLEFPHKLRMSREEYLTVQRVHRGWNRAEYFGFAALLTTLLLAIVADDGGRGPALIAFLAILATRAVFVMFTFPVNWVTQNWTLAPLESWQSLRDRWELSHATSALLYFIAVVCVTLALLVE